LSFELALFCLKHSVLTGHLSIAYCKQVWQ
jgi:hypothetical protein